jgi:hypothetical protein
LVVGHATILNPYTQHILQDTFALAAVLYAAMTAVGVQRASRPPMQLLPKRKVHDFADVAAI